MRLDFPFSGSFGLYGLVFWTWKRALSKKSRGGRHFTVFSQSSSSERATAFRVLLSVFTTGICALHFNIRARQGSFDSGCVDNAGRY